MFRHGGERVTENSTSPRRLLACFGLCLVTGCTMGADPDPRDSAVPLPAPRPPADDGPVVVVAALAAPASAAPLAEPNTRQAQPVARRLVVAIGEKAAHTFDPDLKQAFLATRPGVEGTFLELTDRDVVDSLLVAKADFGVLAGQLSQREQHAGLRQVQIGVELYALAVAPDSPLRSLTPSQVRQIFTGQVREWRELGLPGGTIVPVAPADGKLAERVARVIMPGDDYAASVTRVATERHVADQALRHPGAIGIVVLTDQPMEPGIKVLQIDWQTPTPEAFTYGSYPFGLPVQLVSTGAPSGETLRFLEFARSTAGRGLLGRCLTTR